MVVPYIQGVQRNGVAACVKHFAVNDQETDRFNVEVKIDDRRCTKSICRLSKPPFTTVGYGP